MVKITLFFFKKKNKTVFHIQKLLALLAAVTLGMDVSVCWFTVAQTKICE